MMFSFGTEYSEYCKGFKEYLEKMEKIGMPIPKEDWHIYRNPRNTPEHQEEFKNNRDCINNTANDIIFGNDR